MTLNIRQIEVFSAVMDQGSTIAAANHLHISQPSISKHLKLLETSSGVNLFVRKNNRLEPTPEAHALYQEIKRIYTGMSQLEHFVKNLSGELKFELTIGSISMLAHTWLPSLLTQFLRDYNHYSLAMHTGSQQMVSSWAASGHLDVGLCMQVGNEVTGVDQELLMRLPNVCVMPPDHSKASLSTISVDDLQGENLVTLYSMEGRKSHKEDWRLAVQEWLGSAGIKPNNLISVSTTHTACEFVKKGMGITLVDYLTAVEYEKQGLVWAQSDFDFTYDIYLISPKGAGRSAILGEVLKGIREQAKLLESEVVSRLASRPT